MIDKDLVRDYIVKFAEKNKFRYEVQTFDSGALIIDLWASKDFYCIQIEEKKIGFSKIDDEPTFSSIADMYYEEFTSFKTVLYSLKKDDF